jgi:dTDP-4-amino-4,6-dideoxygalactose transaminase
VAVANGTAALHCACIAAGIKPGDEVITTPITFAASANCAMYCGARPVFADINPETYNIDPDSIKNRVTDKTKAVVAVDFAGQAVEIDKIRSICDKHKLVFIEDAAHSIGTRYKGKQIGSLADMTTFSFHPVKTITCGEGGAILTNDKSLYHKLMLARTHGIERETEHLKIKDEPWYYEQQILGYNYRLTDFQAAMLVSQLGKLDRFVRRRKEIVKQYDQAFSQMLELVIQKEIPESDTSRHLYVLRIDETKLTCDRKMFFHTLSAENIQPQVHYIPVYWLPYYQERGYPAGLCPNAEAYYRNCLSLPLYPMLTDGDVSDVIEAVYKLVNHYRRHI